MDILVISNGFLADVVFSRSTVVTHGIEGTAIVVMILQETFGGPVLHRNLCFGVDISVNLSQSTPVSHAIMIELAHEPLL